LFLGISDVEPLVYLGIISEQMTEFTKAFVKVSSFSITNITNDKFGGRLDADVIRSDGEDLAEALIENDLAYPYFGRIKRGWCIKSINR